MTNNIFDSDNESSKAEVTQVAEAQPQKTTAPTTVEYEFIGEGKKYKSVEDALKSVPHAQEHIKTLEQQLAELRAKDAENMAELQRRRTAEELLTEMNKGKQNDVVTPTGVEADPEVLSQLVERVLEKKQTESVAKNNAQSVVTKLKEVYGDKAREAYISLASSNGMSIEFLDKLAMTSPNALLKLAGVGNVKQSSGKISSDVQTTAIQSNQETVSSRVPAFATSKQMAAAMAAARQDVLKRLN